jgi:hydrogenase nickel incorporation protein HypA/HybF
MHELTIASALVEQVCDHARDRGANRVGSIRVRMGALSGIAKALHFCFPSAAKGTLCDGAVLYIDEVPLTVMCMRCDAVKTPSGHYNFRCPDCGHPTPKVITGREMQLASIELVGADAPPAGAHASAGTTDNSLSSQGI